MKPLRWISLIVQFHATSGKIIPMFEQNKWVEIQLHAFLYLTHGRGDPSGSQYDDVNLL
jgi:hypothetical protein